MCLCQTTQRPLLQVGCRTYVVPRDHRVARIAYQRYVCRGMKSVAKLVIYKRVILNRQRDRAVTHLHHHHHFCCFSSSSTNKWYIYTRKLANQKLIDFYRFLPFLKEKLHIKYFPTNITILNVCLKENRVKLMITFSVDRICILIRVN